MPRPSRQIDQVLLASGRALYPAHGAAKLSVRTLTEHAGVNQAMFHYHFKSKDAFLETLLQQMYEALFAALDGSARAEGAAIERLRHAMRAFGGFAREHRHVVARLWMDALGGEAVAQAFFRRNAPRHVALVTGLLDEARREGALRELAPLQSFVFLMGSVMMPIVFASGLFELGGPMKALRPAFDAQVMSDAAIAQRVDLALAALQPPAAAPRAIRKSARAKKGGAG